MQMTLSLWVMFRYHHSRALLTWGQSCAPPPAGAAAPPFLLPSLTEMGPAVQTRASLGADNQENFPELFQSEAQQFSRTNSQEQILPHSRSLKDYSRQYIGISDLSILILITSISCSFEVASWKELFLQEIKWILKAWWYQLLISSEENFKLFIRL